MNPLTLVKRIQKINTKEADLGISDEASWHAKYKGSAYVFVGGVPYDLTEGDLLAVFSQYGEIVDVNLVRDKGTGKSKGFAFVAYEDQRSTNLAVDNLNGAQVLGRIIRVDHVSDYKKKEEEDEETERKKREERGVCRAFQRGQCTRGASCKFSHDEQRAANTGWGAEEDKSSKWRHDKADEPRKPNRGLSHLRSGDADSIDVDRHRADDHHARSLKVKDTVESYHKRVETDSRDQDRRDKGRYTEDLERRTAEKRASRHESESNSRDDRNRREEKRSKRHDIGYDRRDYRDGREENVRDSKRRGEREERASHAIDSSSRHHRERGDDDYHRSRR